MGERTHFNDESDDSGIGLAVVVVAAAGAAAVVVFAVAVALAVALAVAESQEAATVAAAATREMLICVRCSLVGAGLLEVFKRLSRVFQSAEQLDVT